MFLVRGTPPAASNIVSGKVTDRSYRGAEVIVTVATEIGDILVRLAATALVAAPALGEVVSIGWREETGCLLPDSDG